MKNIKLVGELNEDVRLGIIALLNTFPAEWKRNTMRQDTEGSPHKDTQCIIFRGPSNCNSIDGIFNDPVSVNYDGNLALQWVVQCAVESVMELAGPGVLGRVMITRLRPRGVITSHCDEGLYAAVHTRFHIPLITNLDATFKCGNEVMHMKCGGIYRINQLLEHSAENRSTMLPRVHLIVDVMTPKT